MGFGNLALSADKTNLAVREPGPMQPQPTVASNSGLLFNLQSSRKKLEMTSSSTCTSTRLHCLWSTRIYL